MAAINDCIFQIGKPDKDENFTFLGTAFVIPDYIITAGHVSSFRSIIKNNACFRELDWGRWISNNPKRVDFEEPDFAFYRVEDIQQSPFELAECKANEGDILDIICFMPSSDDVVQKVNCQCRVAESISPLYTKIIPDKEIWHGASGCPVYKNGKVYGIVTGGSEVTKHTKEHWLALGYTNEEIEKFKPGECWMLDADYIRRFIETRQ